MDWFLYDYGRRQERVKQIATQMKTLLKLLEEK